MNRLLPMLLFAAALLDAGTLTLVAAELVRSLQADLSSGQAGGVRSARAADRSRSCSTTPPLRSS